MKDHRVRFLATPFLTLRKILKYTTQSGVTLAGPSVPPPNSSSSSKEVKRDPEPTMDQVTFQVQKVPYESHLQLNKDKLKYKSDIQIHKFLHMFKKLHFNISFAEALAHMPKYAKQGCQTREFTQHDKLVGSYDLDPILRSRSCKDKNDPRWDRDLDSLDAKILKDLLNNKEKLLELANTPLNENCSVVLLKKLPEKFGDLGKFLFPCDFNEIEECMALADLGASINLMPFYVWKKLMLPELTPTRMTLELANRSVAYPVGIAEDVSVQVGRPFLRTACALVDVYVEELILRVGNEKLTFNADSTSKYSQKHGNESINLIDIIDITCGDHFHEVLNVQKSIHPLSGSPTPSSDLVVASLSPSLTSFRVSDSLLEETDAFLTLDSIPPEIDNGFYDSEGDIFFIEKLLNGDPTKDLPPKELKNNETKTTKSLIEEPPELELKDLPPYLEYAFFEGTSKLHVIIAKDLKREENDQISKILLEDDFKPVVQHQRRVNSKIHEVIKAEVIELLDTGLIYPISDSPWVSHVHVVPKKGGMTVVINDNNELILTRLVTG
ncbi:reverse transcriptase domain-containing protein [Tanacetum coccineum]